MRAITVKGYKKTGKTTTCVRIIEELVRRGYSVGSYKSTHFPDFTIDEEGTDSWRQARAGASTVMVMGRDVSEILMYRPVPLKDVIGLYTEDFLVCEGDSGMGFANIITGKTAEDLEQRRDLHTIGFSGIIAGTDADRRRDLCGGPDEYDGLPVIDAMTDIEALVDLIEERSSQI